MKRITLILASVGCAIGSLIVSCKKDRSVIPACTARLHGYIASTGLVSGLFPEPCSHGIINGASATIATAGSFMGASGFNHLATYNTVDHCYYVFQSVFSSPVFRSVLNKIDAAGALTTYFPADSLNYGSVIYNRVNNKLYCVTNTGSLGELTLGATSFSVATVVTPAHIATSNITVDVITGDMYLQTVDTSVYNYFLEKYHPGASTTSVLTALADMRIYLMKFNKNDHMLYALQRAWTPLGGKFVKINPATGAISTLSSGLVFNGDFYSGTLDPCTNRYIYSTNIATTSGEMYMLYQLDMSGVIVQQDTTATMYQGLDVEY